MVLTYTWLFNVVMPLITAWVGRPGVRAMSFHVDHDVHVPVSTGVIEPPIQSTPLMITMAFTMPPGLRGSPAPVKPSPRGSQCAEPSHTATLYTASVPIFVNVPPA